MTPLIARQKPSQVRKQKQSQAQPRANLKVVVREVVVDVVVTGHDGKPVKGLKRQDFRILDDGKPQQIRSFIVHNTAPASANSLPKRPAVPPGVFTNYSATPADAPLNIILMDLGNTPINNVPTVRRQIAEFIREQPLGARYAVFVMGSGFVKMIQGFTAEKDRLLAAIENKRLFSMLYEPSVNPFKIKPTLGATPGVNPFLPFRYAAATRRGRMGEEGGDFGTASGNNWLLEAQGILRILPPHTGMESGKELHWINTQVRNTVNEMARMALLLSALPGRKNLLWFTGSLPENLDNFLHIARDTRRGAILAASDLVVVHNSPKIVQAAELLERSRTAVYAIDTHGLETGSADPRWAKQKEAEHSTLDAMATITGGHAFYNTNGFKHAMATAANEGENYYTLTYIPTNAKFRGELRQIHVELSGRDRHDHLAYRHSYFANSSDAAPQATLPPLAFTLQHGAPTSQQILFWAAIDPSGKPHAEKPKRASANAAKGKRGRAHPRMLQTYVIHLVLVPGMLKTARTSAGKRRTKLQFAARAYDKDGRDLRTILNSAQVTLTPEAYQRIVKTGLKVPLKIAVPVQTAFLRLAVRDDLSNRVGSIELSLPLKPGFRTRGK